MSQKPHYFLIMYDSYMISIDITLESNAVNQWFIDYASDVNCFDFLLALFIHTHICSGQNVTLYQNPIVNDFSSPSSRVTWILSQTPSRTLVVVTLARSTGYFHGNGSPLVPLRVHKLYDDAFQREEAWLHDRCTKRWASLTWGVNRINRFSLTNVSPLVLRILTEHEQWLDPEVSRLSDACIDTRVCVQGVRRRHGALWNKGRGLNCVLWGRQGKGRQGKGRRRMGNQYMASSRGD